jgi:CDP-glucose 4,6-dehydratase
VGRMTSSTAWSGSSVLVTGGSGFLGARLVRALLHRGADVTCFERDHDPASPLWRSGDALRVALAAGRLECFDQVRAAIVEREIDTILHLGAQTLVGVGRRDPIGTFESNVRGTWNVLEACRLHGEGLVRRIVVASSDKAYGDCDTLPYTEDTPLAGRHPYDVSKSCADLIAQSYAHTYALPVGIARCGNLFGPGDLNWSRLVPGTIRALLRGERPVIRSDGSPRRDYLHVDDAVEAYLALADWTGTTPVRSDPERAFNFSTGEPLTVLEMTRRVQAAVGREDLEPRIENSAQHEIAAQHLDAGRARRVLGWEARRDLDAALAETVRWYARQLSEPDAAARRAVAGRLRA